MVDVKERTWTPDEAARAEVLRLYDEGIEAGVPRKAADIARELDGLKTRWTQQVIAAECKARKAAAKAAAKRTPTDEASAKEETAAKRPLSHAQSALGPETPAARTRGAVVAWGAFALGLAVSIASNIGHVVFVVGVDDPLLRFWSMGMAALWPVLLAVAVEVVSRVAWPSSWRWWVPGYIGTAIVGLIAFTISYQHLHGLLLAMGESQVTAVIGPIALDLSIVVAGVALLAIGENKKAEAIDAMPGVAAAAA